MEVQVPAKKPSRKEKRKKALEHTQTEKLNFSLKHVDPLTHNQRLAFEAYENGKNMMLHGTAGTGKSFISLYLALNELLHNNQHGQYHKIIIVRSVVPTRDMGFLPGRPKEKEQVYESPYYSICTELFGRGDSYEYLKNKGIIQFMSTSFIRGLTLNNAIVILDEMANCTLHELDSVITRIGKNCRIIMCGDFKQSDFEHYNERRGLLDFMKIINNMKSFSFIEFDQQDIVRSSMVKDYIIQKERLGVIT